MNCSSNRDCELRADALLRTSENDGTLVSVREELREEYNQGCGG